MAPVLARIKSWLFAEDGDGPEIVPDHLPIPLKKTRSTFSFNPSRSKQDEIFIGKPHTTEDRQFCADCLRADRPVIVNLTDLDVDRARRVLDFLAGVVYALEGGMEAVGDQIYLCTPRRVGIEHKDGDGSSGEYWS
jgi:cell division inhibitor SepF